MEEIILGGHYRHFKGNEYKVLYVALHSETLEKYIVYEALYGNHDTWIRPYDMWSEAVEYEGKTKKRFEYIEE